MNKKSIILPLTVGLLLSLTACGSKREEVKVEETKPVLEEVVIDKNAEAISITAAELSDRYRSNEAISDKEFKKVVAEITGIVESFGEEDGKAYLILKGHETEQSPALVCFGNFDGIKENDQITVRGLISGKTSIGGIRNFVGIEGASIK